MRFLLKHLIAAQASVKFVSFEPLLGSVGKIDLKGIDWAIVGGESGPHSRPMAEEWAIEIRDQNDLIQVSLEGARSKNCFATTWRWWEVLIS
jgi:protein gp37